MKEPTHFAFYQNKYPNGETAVVVSAITPIGELKPGCQAIVDRQTLTVCTEVPTPKNTIMVKKSYPYLEHIRSRYAHELCPTSLFVPTGFQTKEAEEWVLTPRFLKNIKSLP